MHQSERLAELGLIAKPAVDVGLQGRPLTAGWLGMRAQRFLAQKHHGGSHPNAPFGRFFRGSELFAASKGTIA